MTKRHSLWASLIIIGLVLVPGCISIGTWQAYPGKKLPNEETALIKRGNDLYDWKIDGKHIPGEFVVLIPGGIGGTLGDSWERKAIRVLPGEHEISARSLSDYYQSPIKLSRSKSLTFEAEAGRVYTFFGKEVGEAYLVGLVEEGEAHYYVWLKDESGTVIAGEKPPPD